MAMITGRVQIQESVKPRKIEVGSAFAIKDNNGKWKNLKGEEIVQIKIDTEKIMKNLL